MNFSTTTSLVKNEKYKNEAFTVCKVCVREIFHLPKTLWFSENH